MQLADQGSAPPERAHHDAAASGAKRPGAYSEIKQAKLRKDKSNAAAWASLFVRGDVAAKATAERLGVDRATLLTEGSAGDAAVRLALGEAQTIAETKQFFREHGVTVEPPPGAFARSRTVLIVKNLPFKTDQEQLLPLFERHGDVVQLLLPPSRALAIVQFAEVNHAKAAFQALAYAPFQGAPLYLEWAPEGLVAPPTADSSVQRQKSAQKATQTNAEKEAQDDTEKADGTETSAPVSSAPERSAAESAKTTREHVIEDAEEVSARCAPNKSALQAIDAAALAGR